MFNKDKKKKEDEKEEIKSLKDLALKNLAEEDLD